MHTPQDKRIRRIGLIFFSIITLMLLYGTIPFIFGHPVTVRVTNDGTGHTRLNNPYHTILEGERYSVVSSYFPHTPGEGEMRDGRIMFGRVFLIGINSIVFSAVILVTVYLALWSTVWFISWRLLGGSLRKSNSHKKQ